MASSGLSPDNDPLEHSQGQDSKNDVEMNELKTSTEGTVQPQPPAHPAPAIATSSSTEMLQPTDSAAEAETSQNLTADSTAATAAPEDALSTKVPAAASTTAPVSSRLDSVAIGPSTDANPPPSLPSVDTADPVCIITLLLTSGARHPYKLDEKYLTKRNVTVPGVTESGKKDPFSISVYTLKELILREWREEWEARPSSPSSIRLIHFGRLLDDKTPLKECRLNADTANVVHMTIKPQEVVDDEEASKSKALRGDRSDGEGTPGCRCVIL